MAAAVAGAAGGRSVSNKDACTGTNCRKDNREQDDVLVPEAVGVLLLLLLLVSVRCKPEAIRTIPSKFITMMVR